MSSDAIELELFRHLLVSIAEEMGVVLRKTSYSANIKEAARLFLRGVRRA
jgi:N-methylhydantoinase B/oxoprolinase/acetone carboxylase alpha subunit